MKGLTTMAVALPVFAPGEAGAVADAADVDAPCGTARRRRGAALEDAILRAAYVELTDVGYALLSVEAVAARARTGKASIYRRWPTKQELVLDALVANLPSVQACMASADIDDSITTADALREMGRGLATILNSDAIDAIRAIKGDAAADPELACAIDDRFAAPHQEFIFTLLRRGVERGEVRPAAVCSNVALSFPALVMYRVMMLRQQLTEDDIMQMIDDVVLPLIAAT